MLVWCEYKKRWCVLPFYRDCERGLEPVCEVLSEEEFNQKIAELNNDFLKAVSEKPVIEV